MKIIDDNKEFVEALERYARHIGLPHEKDDYTFVNASLIANTGDRRTDRKGIAEAYNIMKKGEKIAIYSFENPQYLYSDKNSKNKDKLKKVNYRNK